jgi:hypothetical protein
VTRCKTGFSDLQDPRLVRWSAGASWARAKTSWTWGTIMRFYKSDGELPLPVQDGSIITTVIHFLNAISFRFRNNCLLFYSNFLVSSFGGPV